MIEAVTNMLGEDLSQSEANENTDDDDLAQAAKVLLSEYQSDTGLTAFSSLDGEDFRHS